MFSNSPHTPKKNLAVYEVMWKNIVERDRLQITIWRMHVLCRLTTATDTHSGYVIFIVLHDNSCCTNAPQYYVIRSLPVLWMDIGILAVGIDGVIVT